MRDPQALFYRRQSGLFVFDPAPESVTEDIVISCILSIHIQGYLRFLNDFGKVDDRELWSLVRIEYFKPATASQRKHFDVEAHLNRDRQPP